jgi:hypothetical protein
LLQLHTTAFIEKQGQHRQPGYTQSNGMRR